MSLLRWDPFADVAQLREQVNRLFEQSLSHATDQPAAGQTWSPPVDIFELPDAIGLRMEIAGVNSAQIDIRIDGDTLTISGERKLPQPEEGKRYVRIERNYGPFQRSFTLGTAIDQERVHASYHDGVLEIVLPKREEAKPKQVKIEVQSTPAEIEA